MDKSKSESERTLEAVLSTVKESLHLGEKIDLRGFGVFKIRESKARQARNPRTGDMVDVPAKSVAVFKPSKDFAASLNEALAKKEPGKKS